MSANWANDVGYLASALVLCAFYMRSMVPLRCVAIASNFAFIAYAVVNGLGPVLFLHACLLPLNILRLAEALPRSSWAPATRWWCPQLLTSHVRAILMERNYER